MTLSRSEQEHYSALAARAEREDYTPIEQMPALAKGQSTTPEELDDLTRDHDVSAPTHEGWIDAPGGPLLASLIADAFGRAATADAAPAPIPPVDVDERD